MKFVEVIAGEPSPSIKRYVGDSYLPPTHRIDWPASIDPDQPAEPRVTFCCARYYATSLAEFVNLKNPESAIPLEWFPIYNGLISSR